VSKAIDILSHEMVPKHEILTKKEKDVLLKQFRASENDLPKIFRNDPAIKGLDANRGDVIRIIRKSPTAGETIYYRVVV
jgi:DNA-directed RNA polymerase subunit H